MATSNVSGGMNYTATNSGSGQRAAGGADPWVWPALQTTSSMSGSTFTVTDMNDALTTTQDDWDLNASNLDGAGTRSFAALSGFIIITYISGTGSVAVAPGTTNPATWFPTCTLGGGATQTRPLAVTLQRVFKTLAEKKQSGHTRKIRGDKMRQDAHALDNGRFGVDRLLQTRRKRRPQRLLLVHHVAPLVIRIRVAPIRGFVLVPEEIDPAGQGGVVS
jgi:hypothetical protein